MILPAAELFTLVQATALKRGLDPYVTLAQVYHESGGDPDASRHERGYPYTWPPPKSGQPRVVYPIPPCSRDTEVALQRTSWGLLQLMGAVARELGYRRAFLNALTREVEAALDLGCLWMARKIARYPNPADALAAYNAGTPSAAVRAAYAEPILASAIKLRASLESRG